MGLAGRDGAEQGTDVSRTFVDEQDRGRVHPHLVHPRGQLVDLGGMDPLVRPDSPIVEARRAAVDGQGADESTDGEAVGGVLVQEERRLRGAGDAAGLLPLEQPCRHGAIGSRECTCGGRISDAGGSQQQGSERFESQRLRHVRRRDHCREVHQSIVGAAHQRPTGG